MKLSKVRLFLGEKAGICTRYFDVLECRQLVDKYGTRADIVLRAVLHLCSRMEMVERGYYDEAKIHGKLRLFWGWFYMRVRSA